MDQPPTPEAPAPVPPEESPDESDVGVPKRARELFATVQKELETKRSVGWEKSGDSLKLAQTHLAFPEAIEFLRSCYHEVVTILLDQQIAKITQHQRSCVETALLTAAALAADCLERDNRAHLRTLIALFDNERSFYRGSKTSWSNAAGAPEVRIKCIRAFSQRSGISLLEEALRHQSWLLARPASILLKAALDVSDDVPGDDALVKLTRTIMSQASRLDGEDLRNDNAEAMSKLLGHINEVMEPAGLVEEYFDFWLGLTLRYLTVDSLPLRLFGWEQIGSLMTYAEQMRPVPSRIEVGGAGAEEVNGVFVLRHGCRRDKLRYTLTTADGVLLTLFRCQMRSQAQWWYISEADPKDPGTDKDVDYYQHKSKPHEERIPPLSNWNSVTGGHQRGVDPPPTLRILEYDVEEGKEADLPEARLVRWILENDVVGSVFKASSAHREVVSRSAQMLRFLAEQNALTAVHLEAVWHTAEAATEAETVEEVYVLLIQLMGGLNADLFEALLQRVRQTLEGKSKDAATGFLQKISGDRASIQQLTQQLDNRALLKLVGLLWHVVSKRLVASWSELSLLLNACLNALGMETEEKERIRLLQECLDQLRISRIPEKAPKDADLENSLKLFQVFVQSHGKSLTDKASLIEKLGRDGDTVPKILNEELVAFRARARQDLGLEDDVLSIASPCSTDGGSADDESCVSRKAFYRRLELRLKVLRFIYGLTSELQWDFDTLLELWEFLDVPQERNMLMEVLKDASQPGNAGGMLAAFSPAVAARIFKELLCDRASWEELGLPAYECFKVYFEVVRGEEGMDIDFPTHENAEAIGLQTLWHIFLTSKSEAVADAAKSDILRVHCHTDTVAHLRSDSLGVAETEGRRLNTGTDDDSDVELKGTRLSLLNMVFRELEIALTKQDAAAKVERLVGVLRGALEQSAGIRPIAHGARSTAGRVSLMPSSVKRSVLSGVGGQGYSTTEPLEPQEIRTHPLLPLRYFCEQIAHVYNHEVEFVRLFRAGPLRNMEATVAEAGLLMGDFNVHLIGEHQINGTGLYGPNYARWSSQPDAYDIRTALPEDGTHLATVIANDSLYLDVLFNVLQSMGQANDNLCREVWALLMSIPTNPSFAEVVKKALVGDGASEAVQWSSILSRSHYQRSIYIMQIVDAFLNPAPEVRVQGDLADQDKCRRAFSATGGLSAVLTLFMSSSDASRISDNFSTSMRGHAAALRIIRGCLFGSPEEDRNSSRAEQPEGVARSSTDLPPDFPLHSMLQRLIDVAVKATDKYTMTSQGQSPATLTVACSNVESMTVDIETQGIITSTLTSALATLTLLLRSKGTVGIFCEAPGTKTLVTRTLVGYPEVEVRSQTAQLLTTASNGHDLIRTVLPWVIEELERLPRDCTTAEQLFLVLVYAVYCGADGMIAPEMLRELSQELLKKLASFSTDPVVRQVTLQQTSASERECTVLEGCLRTLSEVLSKSATSIDEGILGSPLVSFVFDKGLFALPDLPTNPTGAEVRVQSESFCCTQKERVAAFKLLLEASRTSPRMLCAILDHVEALLNGATGSLSRSWNVETTGEEKAANAPFVGLKNQGCTCYMNSLLQQLFMIPSVRHAVLRAKVRRTSRQMARFVANPRDLVGRRLVFAIENGKVVEGQVTGYDEASGMHRVQYATLGEHCFRLKEGRLGRETGDFWFADDGNVQNGMDQLQPTPAPSPVDEDTTAEESQKKRQKIEGGQKLLEQIQRTFAFLLSSEKRYFDPRLLVEACRVLNLQYSVYQQNDAAEFCNTLLDQLEEALKFSSRDMIKELELSFGGKVCYQKLPRDCDHKKNTLETFKTIELIIRGKTSIEESLEAFVEGELMDGDNKVECDGCGDKRACIRRTCIETRPNVLILHLKRFDLDFTTFETVKINSLCRFPTKLNVKRYTRVGIEEMERQEAAENGETEADQAFEELDDAEFDYDLKGVLVHAGVAQGGHYYSFIADRQRQGWYRFDDEDVNPFDASHIAAQCFGGTYTRNSGWHGAQEQERIANALMLFYEKSTPNTDLPVEAPGTQQPAGESAGEKANGHGPAAPADASGPPPTIQASVEESAESKGDFFPLEGDSVEMTGYEAFQQEVLENNVSFIRQKYVFDDALQDWLRDLLLVVGTWEPDGLAGTKRRLHWQGVSPEQCDAAQLRTVRICTSYFFDCLLHSRETRPVQRWIITLCRVFKALPAAASEFISSLVVDEQGDSSLLEEPDQEEKLRCLPSGWLRQYFLEAAFSSARSFAADLMSHAVMDLAIHAERQAKGTANDDVWKLLRRFVRAVDAVLDMIASSIRNTDELMCLIRDLATSEQIRRIMTELDMAGKLVHIALCAMDRTSQELRDLFSETKVPSYANLSYQTHPNPNDLMYVVEAIASLCGARSSTRKKELIIDGELSPEAATAFRRIFRKMAPSGGMDSRDIVNYYEHTGSAANGVGSPNQYHIKNLLSRYHNLPDGRLSEEGFLEHYKDTAMRNAKQVWQDLTRLGFDGNLEYVDDHPTRRGSGSSADPASSQQVAFEEMSDWSARAIISLDFLDVAFDADQDSARHIVAAVGAADMNTAEHLAGTALRSLYVHPHNGWGIEDPYQNRLEILTVLINTIAARAPPIAPVSSDDAMDEEDEGDANGASGEANRMSEASDATEQNPLEEFIDYLLLDADVGVITTAKAAVERSMEVEDRVSMDDRENEKEAETERSRLQRGLAEASWHVLTQVQRKSGILKTLAKSCKSLSAWLSRHTELYGWMGPIGRGRSSSHRGYSTSRMTYDPADNEYHEDAGVDSDESEDNYHDEPPDVMRVVGAGSTDVNGSYKITDTKVDNMPVWFRDHIDPETGMQLSFYLYRCRLTTGKHRWYISVPPRGQTPGTSKDEDYYYAPSRIRVKDLSYKPLEETMPPLTGWEVAQGNNPGMAPAPHLEVPAIASTSPSPSPNTNPTPGSPGAGTAGSDSEDIDVDDAPMPTETSRDSLGDSSGGQSLFTPPRSTNSLERRRTEDGPSDEVDDRQESDGTRNAAGDSVFMQDGEPWDPSAME